jgi:hypothetical protein
MLNKFGRCDLAIDRFNQCWSAIFDKLTPRKLYTWSAAGRAKGSFNIVAVSIEGITVATPRAQRLVSRQDFEAVFGGWDEYRSGMLARHKLRDMSFNSTYILSVLHWLEIQPGTHHIFRGGTSDVRPD